MQLTTLKDIKKICAIFGQEKIRSVETHDITKMFQHHYDLYCSIQIKIYGQLVDPKFRDPKSTVAIQVAAESEDEVAYDQNGNVVLNRRRDRAREKLEKVAKKNIEKFTELKKIISNLSFQYNGV